MAFPHHLVAAHDRPHRPARDAHAIVGRPAGARRDPSVADRFLPFEIDYRHVGIVAGGDAALAGNAEQPRRPGAGEIDENGAVSLASLETEARKIIETSHTLAQQRGVCPIPNRLLFAAFLAERKGYAGFPT